MVPSAAAFARNPFVSTRMTPAFAVGLGAALGALSRWGLGRALDAAWPAMPMGTLVANLVGGYGIGLAVGFFDRRVDLPAAWRLFAVTGFLGGLTTFSTFSAEVASRLAAGRGGLASLEVAAHVAGSVVATLLGLVTVARFAKTRARH